MTPHKPGGNIVAQLSAIERGDDDGQLDFGRGVRLHVSSLSKVYFDQGAVTKGAVMRYYAHIAPVLLPHIDGRPLVLKRYPEGAGGPMFFQQDAGRHVPDVVRVKALHTEAKGERMRIIGGDLVTLLYSVQLGAIEVHPWLSRVADIESADRCLIDLDPGEDVPFSAVVALARDILRIVEKCGLSGAVKTSGSRGLHIVLPLPARTSYETSARLAMRIAEAAVMLRPEGATIERSISARPPGTIYVDAMQNARGKSAASVYSIRARSTPTVSAPLKVAELTARLRMSAFTVRTMPARIARLGDIWGETMDRRPTVRVLARAMHMLEEERPGGAHVGPTTARRRARGA
jgi:bifunctional non-homologous end joining protein LigD